ncbi:hypothetical protein [Salinithrix halophila]
MKKIGRFAVALCLGVTLLVPATMSQAFAADENPNVSEKNAEEKAQASMAPTVGIGANLNVNIDVLGIADKIESAINDNAHRSGFVKNLSNAAYYGAEQKYNVVVQNLEQPHDPTKLQGVKFYGSAKYGKITYGIWVFEGGEFENQGDGGWINWAYWAPKGVERNGGHLKFP